ncbi:MAG: hypothetical protein FWD54_01945 [Endomicrobia bacterium]|nr:hypothetical protein [Endomicrobiia bacterium]
MKKILSLALAAAFVATASVAVIAQKAPAFKPFAVYVEYNSKENHFAPSGWMGDYGDLKLNLASTESPRSGNYCIKTTYSAKMTQGAGWAGIYWQQPANNWGEKKGGYDLTGATKLTFWARGAVGGEKIAEFKMGGITGEFPDSDSAAIGPVELKKEWQKYTIDLKGKDLSHIIGGFCWAASKDDNPNGFIFYLDDIIYE